MRQLGLVSQVDALELQLRRPDFDETQGGTIRNADPAKEFLPGYQASVAEYYRKLSTK